ncbi:MAG: rRNA maturation RNase YbeY [bacterium]|nr:rRNA maturation RNase YbeY [bacterium]
MNKIEISGHAKYKINANQLSTDINQALLVFNCNDASVHINFVSAKEIQKLNKKHRKTDQPTDVLSFPQIDLPNARIKILGDIVISPEIVIEKNEDLSDVAKHGLLHLLGFDHETAEKLWLEAAHKIDCSL